MCRKRDYCKTIGNGVEVVPSPFNAEANRDWTPGRPVAPRRGSVRRPAIHFSTETMLSQTRGVTPQCNNRKNRLVERGIKKSKNPGIAGV